MIKTVSKILLAVLILMGSGRDVFAFQSGQQSLDSLFQLLQTQEKGTEKVELLEQISMEFVGVNEDSAIFYGQQAVYLAKELISDQKIAESHYNLGVIHYHYDNYHLALHFFTQSKEYWKQLGQYEDLLDCTNSMGVVYKNLGQYVNAIDAYLEALHLSEDLGSDKNIAYVKGNMGIVYDLQGNYEKALENFNSALEIFEELDLQGNLAATYSNIGNVYLHKKDYEKALEYYMLSLEERKKEENDAMVAISEINLGVVHHDQGNYDEALKYFTSSLETFENIGDKREQARGLNNIGSTYLKMNDFDNAEEKFLESLELALEVDAREVVKTNYQNLSELYELTGDYASSLKYHKLFGIEKDSLYNEQNSRIINEMQTRYEIEVHEGTILALERDNIELEKDKLEDRYAINKQRIAIYVISFILLVALTFLLLFMKQSRLKRRILQEKQDGLKDKLMSKERELLTTGKYISEKNRVLLEANTQLADIIENSNEPSTKRNLKQLRGLIDQYVNNYEDWNDFKTQFEELHPGFIKKLSDRYPHISDNDLKMCIYLKSNLPNKEIAQLLNISVEGVKSANKRLKKKMEVPKDVSLAMFIRKL